MSIDRSGVLTSIAPRVVSQNARDFRFDRVEIGGPIALDRRAGLLARGRVAQEEDDFGRAARRQFQLRAHRGARVQAAPTLLESGAALASAAGFASVPIAADELAAIARQLRLRAAHVGEGDARAESHIPGIAREDRAGFGILLGFDERERSGSRRAEHPLDESGDAEMARAVRFIGQSKARYLDRSFEGHELKEVGGDAVRGMLEAAVAAAVTCDIGRLGVADRKRRRAPDIAGLFVPQIEGLARRIADGIVRPGRELVLAAVGGPSIAAALGRGLEAECGIGDDVDPGRRRRLARPEYRHVFLASRRKSAEPVEEFELRRAERRGSLWASRRALPCADVSARSGSRCDRVDRTDCHVARQARRGRRRPAATASRRRSGPREARKPGPAGDRSRSGPRLACAHQRLDRHLKVLHV